jgi:hypothetical protein
MNTYHIEYIVHLEIEAENTSEALELGSQELHTLDGDGLANCCEFLDIEQLTKYHFIKKEITNDELGEAK